MARERRIEYPGAMYHVNAEGIRGGPIVLDDDDRKSFERTLEQLVVDFGFDLIAYVLMDKHYHLLIRTPSGNLVAGMQWFQNTWTRRFNARHKMWGRLFGDRYKARPVGEGEYVGCMLDYIHLNPVRAGLVARKDGIENYCWSSLGDYLAPPRTQRKWVSAEIGLETLGFMDDTRGRRKFLERLETMVAWDKPKEAGTALPDGQSLQSTMDRGWYFGSEALREKLVRILAAKKPYEGKPPRLSEADRPKSKEQKLAEAERIVKAAERFWEMDGDDWKGLPKGDWRKGMVALLVRRDLLAGCAWLSETLHMGALSAVSRYIAIARQAINEDKKMRKQCEGLEKMIKSID